VRALRRATPLLLALLVPAALAACASSRQAEGPELARAAGWHWRIMPAGAFDLAVASSRRGGGDTLTVYLEGDGLAYVWRGQPALDPTPTDPVALRLALADPGKTPVAWIGRPCQYTLPDHGRHCQSAEWTGRRYAPEILDSIGAALDALKRWRVAAATSPGSSPSPPIWTSPTGPGARACHRSPGHWTRPTSPER
jgi:hypothetical protein